MTKPLLLYLYSFIDIILSVCISFRTYFTTTIEIVYSVADYRFRHFLLIFYLFIDTHTFQRKTVEINTWTKNSRFLCPCFPFKHGKSTKDTFLTEISKEKIWHFLFNRKFFKIIAQDMKHYHPGTCMSIVRQNLFIFWSVVGRGVSSLY